MQWLQQLCKWLIYCSTALTSSPPYLLPTAVSAAVFSSQPGPVCLLPSLCSTEQCEGACWISALKQYTKMNFNQDVPSNQKRLCFTNTATVCSVYPETNCLGPSEQCTVDYTVKWLMGQLFVSLLAISLHPLPSP